MMNRFNNIIFILLILILYSCTKEKINYKNSTAFTMTDIPAQEILTGEMIEVEDILRPIKIYIKDTLLFTIDNNGEFFVNSYLFKPDIKKIGDFIEFGSGPNEFLDLKSLQFVDSLVWGFDKQRSRLNQYSYSQFLVKGDITPYKTISLKETMSNRALVVNNKIFINSLSYPDARFSIYDMEGHFLLNAGELPDSGEEQTPLEKLESYFNNMVLSPDNELIFVAYLQTDLIEIYDKDGNLKVRRQGPDHFFPARKEINDGAGKRVLSKIGETRDAYFNPVAFNDEIWVLYSGKLFDPSIPNNELVNKIIVFDWDGKPIKVYTTDIGIFSFAVDRNHHVIYGITINPEFSIVTFKYH